MKISTSEPGWAVSGGAHVALLIAALLGFSDTKKFEDAQESIPVEMLTEQQFNQVMKGDKTAKEVKPQPKADKVADITETKPTPPIAEAKRDVPTPPPPLKRIPDPGEDDKPEPPKPPERPQERVAVIPPTPPKPEPPKPVEPEPVKPPVTPPVPPARTEAKPPPPEDAEPVENKPAPKPPVRPEPPKQAEDKPPPPPKVRPTDKPKLDTIAKLLEQKKLDELAAAAAKPDKPAEKPAEKPASKPKSGQENDEQKPKVNLGDISRLLSKDAAQQKASTGKTVSQQASLGSATASAPKMSPSLSGQLDGLMLEQYKQCWNNIGLVEQKYYPTIRVHYTLDGYLSSQPVLVNPPSDPALQSVAESAMRAVRRCNPLKIPAQFQPYYEQWKDRQLRFDPADMAG